MWKTFLIACVLVHITVLKVSAQTDWVEWKQDVSTEEDLADWRERYSDLTDLAEHPFNINTITKEQLEKLPFLSDRMIEHILYYVYKYGPLLTKNELLGVEEMDRQTRHFLKDFIYIGPTENKQDRLSFNKVMKYGKQELLTRVDIPLNGKAGYADYKEEVLRKYPNRKYAGDPYYHHLRYRFNYHNRISWGLTAEKDAGEPFFCKYNRKGYDSYSGYLFLENMGALRMLALGHYKASFGYGLVLNTGGNFFGKGNVDVSVHRFGNGFSKYTSTDEWRYLQGAAATFRWKNWNVSAFYSYKPLDALVDNVFIRSFKTDGYHRTENDMKKKHTVRNQLAGADLSFIGQKFEIGTTCVYTHFNKVLNPTPKPYNLYYPHGADFFHAAVRHKWFLGKFIWSGETAVDKGGRVATIQMLSYSPDVHTSLFFINRYFDKKYQAVYADCVFSENSRLQNEAGSYIGFISSLLSGKMKLTGYVDIFHFFYRRYQVDKDHTSGVGIGGEVSYSPINSLGLLIKYKFKDKAKNYGTGKEEKFVLPYVSQRVSFRARYSPYEHVVFKTGLQYVRAGTWQRGHSDGYLGSATAQADWGKLPVRTSFTGAWFKTGSYDSRIYLYEPGLLYAFSMPSFYGRGMRYAVKAQYEWKKRVMVQAKWGCTRYADRDKIGTGTEEIQGNKKFDLQLLLRLKW